MELKIFPVWKMLLESYISDKMLSQGIYILPLDLSVSNKNSVSTEGHSAVGIWRGYLAIFFTKLTTAISVFRYSSKEVYLAKR